MFKLCLAVGGDRCIHPDILGQYLNRRQVLEWMAFFKLFPFGDDRADFRAALQTFWLRSAWLEDAGEPGDYMPNFENAGTKTPAQLIVADILASL